MEVWAIRALAITAAVLFGVFFVNALTRELTRR